MEVTTTMKYNILVKTATNAFNIFGIEENQLSKLVNAYKDGDPEITFSGKKYSLVGLSEIKIFTFVGNDLQASVNHYMGNVVQRRKRGGQYYLPSGTLEKMGDHVTKDIIGDHVFGENINKTLPVGESYVSLERIKEMKAIVTPDADLRRLVRLCEELNDNYGRGNFLSVAIIGRALIDHVPPLFKFGSFDQLTANYGGAKDGKSFKKHMKHLNESLRSIADGYLHVTVRSKEALPTRQQVEFRSDIDALLMEIVRTLS
ncbi:hypothetical protein [Dawidia soli]|uniref:Uncharacterized protein n=1 Tax=Dawidia soli TaxID=2782352 RepID=A0AAP2GKB7_9BACT|nr:hypothetical protein [Dawidia soli]MBT1688868.1 hypothetical protein [Dawidia soli]